MMSFFPTILGRIAFWQGFIKVLNNACIVTNTINMKIDKVLVLKEIINVNITKACKIQLLDSSLFLLPKSTTVEVNMLISEHMILIAKT